MSRREPVNTSDRQLIVDYLTEHGPTGIYRLSKAIGLSWQQTVRCVSGLEVANPCGCRVSSEGEAYLPNQWAQREAKADGERASRRQYAGTVVSTLGTNGGARR